MADSPRLVQINTQQVPVGRGMPAAAIIAVLLMAMFLELPGIRGTAVWGGGAGLLLAAALIAWNRRRTHAQAPRPTLGLKADR